MDKTQHLPRAVSSPGFALTKVQDLALDLIKLHEAPVGLKVLLDDIPLPSCTPQPGLILRLAGGPLDPTLHTTDETQNSTGPSMDPQGTPLMSEQF